MTPTPGRSDPQRPDPDARSNLVVSVTAGALVVVIAARMLGVVLDAGKLQYNDYWPVMGELLRDDGWPRPASFFAFRNEHPIVVAKMLYWLNARLGSGSNETLGLIVIAIVVAQVAILAVLAHRTFPPSRIARAAFVVAAAALLYAPQGAWNFYKAMSGAAWLSANLFVVLALWMQHQRSRWGTIAAAVVATASYGTGVLVWPALMVAAMVRDRRRWPPLEFALAFAVSVVWYSLATNRQNTEFFNDVASGRFEGSTWSPGLVDRIRLAASLVGSLGPGPDVAIGMVVLVTGIGMVVWAARTRPDLAPWIGLFAFGFASIVLVALGRGLIIEVFGTPSRYASLGALTMIGWLALAMPALASWAPNAPGLLRSRGDALFVVCCASLVIWTAVGGRAVMDDRRASRDTQELLEALFRLDLADGSSVSMLAEKIPPITDRLRSLGHYPFDGSGQVCGEFGDRVAAENAAPLTAVSIGQPVELAAAPGASRFQVELLADGPVVECLIALDADRMIIGQGYRVSRSDVPGHLSVFDVVVRSGDDVHTIVATDDGTIRRIESG